MSPRLPRVTAAQIVRVLEKQGFWLSRQSGSHRIYKNEAGKRVTVPYPKVLKSILRDADLTVEQFRQLLRK